MSARTVVPHVLNEVTCGKRSQSSGPFHTLPSRGSWLPGGPRLSWNPSRYRFASGSLGTSFSWITRVPNITLQSTLSGESFLPLCPFAANATISRAAVVTLQAPRTWKASSSLFSQVSRFSFVSLASQMALAPSLSSGSWRPLRTFHSQTSFFSFLTDLSSWTLRASKSWRTCKSIWARGSWISLWAYVSSSAMNYHLSS